MYKYTVKVHKQCIFMYMWSELWKIFHNLCVFMNYGKFSII